MWYGPVFSSIRRGLTYGKTTKRRLRAVARSLYAESEAALPQYHVGVSDGPVFIAEDMVGGRLTHRQTSRSGSRASQRTYHSPQPRLK